MQFTQGLHRAVQRHPDTVATHCDGRSRTFRELHDRVARLAGGLRALGIGRGDRVCVLALNADHYLETYLAVAWLGAVINPANFRWSADEIVYALNDSGSDVLVIDDAFAPMLPSLCKGRPRLHTVIHCGKGTVPEDVHAMEALIATATPVADVGAGGDTLFGIFYTGGTTGRPKGVMLTHANLCSSALALMADGALPEGTVGLHAAPMFHLADMMLTTCLLLRGGTHVMLPAFRPDAVLDLIEHHQITDLLLVPAMLQALVDFPGARDRDTSSVQRILYGASPAAEALINRVQAVLPGASLMQVYGMTEMSAVMTILEPTLHMPEARVRGKIASGGRAACHVLLRIVDTDGNECPRGKVGEITATGPGVMLGYLNQPDATAEAVRAGWMHTGDLGYMDEEGYVFVVDRLKDMIISGGENVYSSEVEQAIARHPAVAACAVVGIPCPQLGEKVHAAVVMRSGQTLDQTELYEHCKQLIAGYKCPRSLELRETLPISGAGKILKSEIRKPFWENRARGVN